LSSVIGSPPVAGAASSFRSSRTVGSFFSGRPPGAGPAHAIRRAAVEAGVELFPPAADGIDVQAGNEGEGGVAAVADFLGLEGGQPAALLLIETAHQEVEVGMPVAVRVVWTALAMGARALIHGSVCHDEISAAAVLKMRGTLYGKSWK
jgi:hypothetical protein